MKIRSIAAAAAVLTASAAFAESGTAVNIHLEPGVAIPIADPLETGVGRGVFLKVDVPLLGRLAAQAQMGALSFGHTPYLNPGTGVLVGLGARVRLLDDKEGYLWHLGAAPPEGHRGNLFGNVWLDASAQLLRTAVGTRFGLDVGLGVEASLVDGLQIGPFVKFLKFDPENVLMVGISLSIGVPETAVHETDTDGDGLPVDKDKCPDQAEDKDGFEDDDGCPEDDNDKDGFKDPDDRCPNEAEDKDGFQDEDGCPDPDNDGDGVPDATDQCPTEKEDRDGFEDEDGCPDPDNDQDQILDEKDKCPNQPEDKDGFEDEDGCPDPDNDQDGVADAQDKCPDKPETRDGVDDEDGCPEAKARVYVENKRIVITEKIFFEFNKARILPRSFGLLDSVAQVMERFPQIEVIRVEGHTDDVGNDAYNQKLSENRARSVVDYLVKKGVDPKRLEAVGYGETKPLVEGKTSAAREKNRRVEFTIVKPEGGIVPVVTEPPPDKPEEAAPDAGSKG